MFLSKLFDIGGRVHCQPDLRVTPTSRFIFTLILMMSCSWLSFFSTAPVRAQANPIQLENNNAGTTSWRLNRPADDRGMQIKAYASHTSVSRGDRLDFYVSTNPAQRYRTRIYRMGFYNGLGARLVYDGGWRDGITQSVCPVDRQTGFTKCTWTQSLTIVIDSSWTTGIYLAKFENALGYDTYQSFALKDDLRLPDFYYQQPVTTYQAYNAFPDDGVNGKNAYDAFSWGPPTITGSARAVRLSFDRPIENTGAERFFMHEHDLIMFLEEHGYDIGYQTNMDTHVSPDRIQLAKGFISPGHDEYWTRTNFDAVEFARDSGVNLAFFGANTAYWQIRLTDDIDTANYRTMEIYKNANIDPEPVVADKTVTFRALGRAEQTLTGVQYVTYGRRDRDTDFIARNTDHWIYRDTGLVDGDRIRGIVGIEVDKVFTEYASPQFQQFTIIGQSPFVGDEFPEPVLSEAVVYQALSGAWVFASGTLLWGQGLNHPDLRSEPLRVMTKNLLNQYADTEDERSISIAVQELTVSESTGVANVEVRLSDIADQPVRFSIATRDNTAMQGVDYYGLYKIADIPAGETSRTIPVTVLDDDEVEEPEMFYARIFAVTGAQIDQAQATVTIESEDSNSIPNLSVSSRAIAESAGRVNLSVTLSAAAASTVRVEYATNQDTAQRGLDYYGKYDVLVFEPGVTRQNIEIELLDDDVVEQDERFRVRLFRPVGARLGLANGTVTLQDDD